MAIIFLHHKNSQRRQLAACKLRAEWTFSLKPRTLES
jgi:hypothetical protein